LVSSIRYLIEGVQIKVELNQSLGIGAAFGVRLNHLPIDFKGLLFARFI
jgi:hypothetical protein